jgi:hypothetical protein
MKMDRKEGNVSVLMYCSCICSEENYEELQNTRNRYDDRVSIRVSPECIIHVFPVSFSVC